MCKGRKIVSLVGWIIVTWNFDRLLKAIIEIDEINC